MRRQPRRRRDPDKLPYAQLVMIFGVVALLVAGILIMAGGSDDPLAEQIVPPLEAETGATGESEVTPYTSQAIDGAPIPRQTEPNAPEEHEDPQGTGLQPEGAASATGSMVSVARRFAQLSINRPTDPVESSALNQDLVELSAGTLARDLANSSGESTAAQIPSTGEILDLIELEKENDYGEVLVVTKLSVIDINTKKPLDPTYINYLVRLEQTPTGSYAVTSWEPQM